jgi:hypothetical protein
MAELHDHLETIATAYRNAARPPGPAAARRQGHRRRLHQASAAGLLAIALLATGATLSAQLLTDPRPRTAVTPATPPATSDPTLDAIPPHNDREGVERTGPIVLVTQGVDNGNAWKLATYPSGKRTCSVVIRNGFAGHYACGFDVPRRRPVMSTWTGAAANPDTAFVHGQVVQQATRVRLEFPHQPPIDLPALQPPTPVGVRFFAASITTTTLPTAVVALDQHGTKLGRENLRWPTTQPTRPTRDTPPDPPRP